MQKIIHAGALGLALATAAPLAAANAAVDRPFPVITVSGEAEVTAVPDVAETTAGVTTEAKTVKEAGEANAQAMTAVVDALRAAGLSAKDMQTGQISVQPVYSQPKKDSRPEEPRITGYRVSNRVRLKIRDLARLGEVLDQAMAAGATDVFGISFIVSESSKVLDAARAEAMADAKRKADIYAKAAGAQVGRAVDIAESGGAMPRPLRYAAAADKRMLAAAPTPVSVGENTLHVGVTVTYELLH